MKKLGKRAICLGTAAVGAGAFALSACAQESGPGGDSDVFILGYIPEDEATEALQYTLSDDGASYAVSGFAGADPCVIVPYMVGEIPVKAVAEDAFSNSGAETVILSRGIERVEARAFSCCGRLTTLLLPKGLTAIAPYAFTRCGSLAEVALPAGLTAIESYAFYGCGLESLVLPDGLTALGTEAFGQNLRLQSVSLPSSLTEIPDYAFRNCDGLEQIALPEGVGLVGAGAFRHCDSLKTVYLPASLATLGDSAFRECGKLSEIRFGGTAAQWRSVYKYNNWNGDTGGFTVVCSDGVLDRDGNMLQ